MTTEKKQKKILLIDNNLSFANKIKKSIDLLGYEITVSNSLEIALQALQPRKFDLVIIDGNMPENTAQSVLDRIRNHNKPAAVFITSEQMVPDQKDYYLSSGASDYFLKQFEVDRLLMSICKLP